LSRVKVKMKQTCRAPAEVVWRVIAEPVISATLDERVSLVATSGEQGTVGSTYELDVQAIGVLIRQYVEVVEAQRPHRLTAVTRMEGSKPVVQTAELVTEGTETTLRWTATVHAPAWLADQTRRHMERELRPWLQAAAAKALGLT
jgi:carbon monoxide dehydrogenase subunit G